MATQKTVTILKYLRSEAKLANWDLTFNRQTDQIIDNSDLKLRFMGKIMTYDSDVEELVNDRLFLGLKLTNADTDRTFKQWFINIFLNVQIDFQTIDLFRAELAGEFIAQKQYIEVLFEHYKDFLTGGNETNTSGDTTSRSNTAFSALPQDTAQMNLDTDIMNFPDSNGLNRGKAHTTTNSNGTKYDPEALDQMRTQMDKLRKYFSRRLFYKL